MVGKKVLLLLVFLAHLWPFAAHADEDLMAVLAPRVEGHLSQAGQERLLAAVSAGLRDAQLGEVLRADLDAILSGEPELQRCRDDECLDRIGHLLTARGVLTQSWQVLSESGAGGGASYRFTVALFNVPIGAQGASEMRACDHCSFAQAEQTMERLVRDIVLLDAARARGTLVVSATPSADVLVDGRKLGFTPYKRTGFAGPHDITVARTGYRAYHTTVTIREGRRASLQVDLVPGSGGRGSRPRWRIIAGAVTAAVGLGLVAWGAVGLGINGKCVNNLGLDPVSSLCPQVYQSTGAGGALLGVGLVLSLGGAGLIAWPGSTP